METAGERTSPVVPQSPETDTNAAPPAAGGTWATILVAAISRIGTFTSSMYRHAAAAAGSKFEPVINISEPGVAAGLLPAPPLATAMAGTGRAVRVKVTGVTPGTDAVTATVPAE